MGSMFIVSPNNTQKNNYFLLKCIQFVSISKGGSSSKISKPTEPYHYETCILERSAIYSYFHFYTKQVKVATALCEDFKSGTLQQILAEIIDKYVSSVRCTIQSE